MIYTIGYQTLTAARLILLLREHGVTHLIDVRSKPFSRFAAFNKKAIAARLHEAAIHYEWAGDRLGGFSDINEEAISQLAETARHNTVCLICMEADPDRCHRKTEIARRLHRYNVPVHHIVV